MNIQVLDLDKAYEKCESLNLLVSSKGEKLISDLGNLITNLKNHWRGTDANAHIGNLCNLYGVSGDNGNGLVGIITDSKKITAIAADAMIDIQRIRNANGGMGSIGSELSRTAPASSPMSPAAHTTEYYCDPAAQADYTELQQVTKSFNDFKVAFIADKDELMKNWTAGAGHEDAVRCFKAFEDNIAYYESSLSSALENLGTAVANISKLG